MNSRTIATVSLGTGIASGILDLFDNVIEWETGAKYDAIHFEGGGDIHPSIYGCRNTDSHVNEVASGRDRLEIRAMTEAIRQGALIIGSCRGAQLACALAGGKLVQDVTNHTSQHSITTVDGTEFMATSVHHQQMYPWDIDHDLLAWSTSNRSDHYHGDNISSDAVILEPEAVYFPTIHALGFQWHPEWAVSSDELEFTIKTILRHL